MFFTFQVASGTRVLSLLVELVWICFLVEHCKYLYLDLALINWGLRSGANVYNSVVITIKFNLVLFMA